MTIIPERAEVYFSTARTRHQMYLSRKAGEPWPWSSDKVLNNWRFTCVFREMDRTTVWFREHVRERMRAEQKVLLATVVFRLFNRTRTGESIFLQKDMLSGKAAWEMFLESGEVGVLRDAIVKYCGDGPYVTGAYIIKTPQGYSKLDGVLQIIEWFCEDLITAENRILFTLEGATGWLEANFRFIGWFTAYEIVTDLRHTDMLCGAPDIMTWANPGPGATRGLNHLHGRRPGVTPPRKQLVEEMRELLSMSQDKRYWPQWVYGDDPDDDPWLETGEYKIRHFNREDWPAWEMRDCEHFSCEMFKYWRARDTGVMPRGRFRHEGSSGLAHSSERAAAKEIPAEAESAE